MNVEKSISENTKTYGMATNYQFVLIKSQKVGPRLHISPLDTTQAWITILNCFMANLQRVSQALSLHLESYIMAPKIQQPAQTVALFELRCFQLLLYCELHFGIKTNLAGSCSRPCNRCYCKAGTWGWLEDRSLPWRLLVPLWQPHLAQNQFCTIWGLRVGPGSGVVVSRTTFRPNSNSA